ncbi:MAG TPA: trypsin-like peptidase domain-containing protein [Chthoniobacteraceae bacterium]|nr:trypsin-like peptidase domain-containing protein [Chthoniobacteraceae bacterium]
MKLLKFTALPALIALSFSTALVGVSNGQDAKPADKPDPVAAHNFLQQLNDGFTGIYDKAAPSVVIIDTTKKATAEDEEDMGGFEFFFRGGPQGQNGAPVQREPVKSEGSGFFIRPDGYILTNNHVIEDAETINVRTKDGHRYKGTVVGADEMADIAVVKIDAKDTPVLPFADIDSVKVGQMVCSIGTPFNFNYSFAFGWVSGKGRANLPGEGYEDYLQTDSFVNPGDSGGPVLDINGKVVGMNTLINGLGRKMTFAIPSDMLKDVSDQLIANGKITRSWLGIGIASVGDDVPASMEPKGIDHGAIVTMIRDGAPASNSDLRATDVITQVDGKDIDSAHELQREIMKKKVGQKVDLTVWRDGKSINVAVVTGALPNMTQVANDAPTPQKRKPATAGAAKDAGAYGFKVQDLGSDSDAKGVLVIDVTDKSPAATAGVQKDDIITEVDSQPVQDADSFKALVDKHDSGTKDKGLLLFINRNGEKTYAIVKPK